MLNLNLSKKSQKFLTKIPTKHLKQIDSKIKDIRNGVEIPDITKVHGSDIYSKVSVGEYRVIFYISNSTLYVDTIGKRNDGEVYRRF